MVPANRVLRTRLERKPSETCRLLFIPRAAEEPEATRFTGGGLLGMTHDMFKGMKNSFYKYRTNTSHCANVHWLNIGGLFCFLFVFLMFPQDCSAEKEVLFSGGTMGTTYHIKLLAGNFRRTSDLQKKIEVRLSEINQSMSTYLKDSEISRFNRWDHTEKPFKISHDFEEVMAVSQRIYLLTGGAWDATVKPLVDLWGFGSKGRVEQPPSGAVIREQLKKLGFDKIEWSGQGVVRKRKADVSLDFASIAKGYAVDQVALLIRSQGTENFIVEIGGEVFASGRRANGAKWRIGVNRPSIGASFNDVYKVVPLSGQAMATSGDYRNFFEKNGVVYNHIIDPRTGYPVQNGVVSVTIIADTCTLADGLATGVMVMGVERGLALIERLAGVEALIIVGKTAGQFKDYPSSGFPVNPE
jgi:thiamine biosynthesis lipoprotein